jgi:hypothetical protein
VKPEQRCLVGTIAGATIGALTAVAICEALEPNSAGAYLYAGAAVLLLNAMLVGLRVPPLVRMSFSARQGAYVAAAFIAFGTSLLYGLALPEVAVNALIVAGTCIMAYGLFGPPRGKAAGLSQSAS